MLVTDIDNTAVVADYVVDLYTNLGGLIVKSFACCDTGAGFPGWQPDIFKWPLSARYQQACQSHHM